METITTKSEALALFGKNRKQATLKLAEALQVSRQSVYQFPEQLPLKLQDRITGAAMRLGMVDKVRFKGLIG